MSGLTLTGRDQRIHDSFKCKSVCHKEAVIILSLFVKDLPHITYKWQKQKDDDHVFNSSFSLTPSRQQQRTAGGSAGVGLTSSVKKYVVDTHSGTVTESGGGMYVCMLLVYTYGFMIFIYYIYEW